MKNSFCSIMQKFFLDFSGVFWRQLNCSNLFPESSLLRKNQWLLVLGYKKCQNFSKSKEYIFPLPRNAFPREGTGVKTDFFSARKFHFPRS